MQEFSHHRERKTLLFLMVCAMHAVLAWFLLTTSKVMRLSTARSFELLVFSKTEMPVPTTSTVKQQSALPRNSYPSTRRPVVSQEKTAESTVQTKEVTPPVDWDAELAQVARGAAGTAPKTPIKNFGFPTAPPTIEDYPQFDWDYARTHRVESLPEGGMVIHLNDNCVLVLSPFPLALCSPFKRKANGELFKHMRDPDKPGDAGIP